MLPEWQIHNLSLMYISSALAFIVLYCSGIRTHGIARVSENCLASKFVARQIQDLETKFFIPSNLKKKKKKVASEGKKCYPFFFLYSLLLHSFSIV